MLNARGNSMLGFWHSCSIVRCHLLWVDLENSIAFRWLPRCSYNDLAGIVPHIQPDLFHVSMASANPLDTATY